jgi:phospholipase C
MHRPAVVALLLLLLACTPSGLRAQAKTATPIKHLVVMFDENDSFDHYFATYPYAQPNLDGPDYFGQPKDGTPLVNGLTPTLLTNNESNWGLGTIGDPQSFDVMASGTIMGMFDFNPNHDHHDRKLILDPTTGQVFDDSGGH